MQRKLFCCKIKVLKNAVKWNILVTVGKKVKRVPVSSGEWKWVEGLSVLAQIPDNENNYF